MKKETLKDWVKGWSVKSIIGEIARDGMYFTHTNKNWKNFQESKRIMVNEINRRIRNAKKL